MHFISKAIS